MPVSSPRKPSRTRLRLESCSTAFPTPTLSGEGRARLFSEGSNDFTLPHACTDITNQEEVLDGRSRTPPRATVKTQAAVVRSGTASPPPKQRSDTPPLAPRRRSLPPLMKALAQNSLDKVQQVLEEAPSAAPQLFWEHDCEPPICCAARFGCNPAIFTLLLQHGADVDAVDRRGRTPLGIVSSEPCLVQPLPDMFTIGAYIVYPMDTVQVARQQNLDVARLLMGALADMEHVDLSGSRPSDHALRVHNQPLLQVLVDCGCRRAAEVTAAFQGGPGFGWPMANRSLQTFGPGWTSEQFSSMSALVQSTLEQTPQDAMTDNCVDELSKVPAGTGSGSSCQ